jgi:hypothetical protein
MHPRRGKDQIRFLSAWPPWHARLLRRNRLGVGKLPDFHVLYVVEIIFARFAVLEPLVVAENAQTGQGQFMTFRFAKIVLERGSEGFSTVGRGFILLFYA